MDVEFRRENHRTMRHFPAMFDTGAYPYGRALPWPYQRLLLCGLNPEDLSMDSQQLTLGQ